MRIALVGCLNPPQEDLDAAPLTQALAARGHVAVPAAWDDPAVEWSSFDCVLLRSAWNYFHDRAGFLRWAARVDTATTLRNPFAVVDWNTHKFYLQQLASRGVDIVPTEFLRQGTRTDVARLLAHRGWESAVLKPAVSADSFATLRIDRHDPGAGQAHLDTHQPHRDMLVQRYLPTIVEPGERCLVFIAGEFSHAVRKRSLFQGGRHVGPEGVPVEAALDEIAAASRALDATGLGVLLYARVDLIRDEAGTPLLLELELTEPSLFLTEGPGSAARFAAAIERWS
jgi:glutathione synthase/RimK-type ligase-like ATP-grasp enzyme